MAIRLLTVKCPNCGQTLSIENNRTQAFCTYCGSKVLIHNENEYILRTIDEAHIQQAETDRLIKLKELELEEKRLTQQSTLRKILMSIWLIVSIAILLIVIVRWISKDELFEAFLMLLYLGGPVIGGGAYLLFHVLPEKEAEQQLAKSGGIRFPKGLEPFSEKHYSVVKNALSDAGFTNIRCVNLHDLNIFTVFVNNGKVNTISVDGKAITSAGKMFKPDAQISITYHGK